ncbi:MAG: PEP-CTERM sorting domain-containing protein [Candidatus Omnitrophota bacterium]
MPPIKNTSGDRSMLKRILFALFVVTVTLSVMSSAAYAASLKSPQAPKPIDYTADFTSADTYQDNGSTTLEDHFNTSLGESPWLKLVLSGDNDYEDWNSPSRNSSVTTDWFFGDTKMFSINTNGGSDKTKDTYWLSPSTDLLQGTGLTWNDLKNNYGAWHINASYEWKFAGNTVTGTANNIPFTMTPEPISMVLFGLGAGVLGLAQVRRKKK